MSTIIPYIIQYALLTFYENSYYNSLENPEEQHAQMPVIKVNFHRVQRLFQKWLDCLTSI